MLEHINLSLYADADPALQPIFASIQREFESMRIALEGKGEASTVVYSESSTTSSGITVYTGTSFSDPGGNDGDLFCVVDP